MDIELLKWLVTITLHMTYVLTIGAGRIVAKQLPKCPSCGGVLKLRFFIPPLTKGYVFIS